MMRGMDEKVRRFFSSLDRARFIDNEYRLLAKVDGPLPIGHGQTISQPSLVVYMTEQLQLEKSHKVLEIGTGSGYQTAFLAEFTHKVYTVEIIEELGTRARERLDLLGYRNIDFKIGDGNEGWAEFAPYNRIMVTAAPQLMPMELVDQLAPGGIMMLPIGPSGWQELVIISKDMEGNITKRKLLDVSFVPLVKSATNAH